MRHLWYFRTAPTHMLTDNENFYSLLDTSRCPDPAQAGCTGGAGRGGGGIRYSGTGRQGALLRRIEPPSGPDRAFEKVCQTGAGCESASVQYTVFQYGSSRHGGKYVNRWGHRQGRGRTGLLPPA